MRQTEEMMQIYNAALDGDFSVKPTWADFWGASLGTSPSSCPAAPSGLETLSNPFFPSSFQISTVPSGGLSLPGPGRDSLGQQAWLPPCSLLICTKQCRVSSSLFMNSSGVLRDLHRVQCRGGAPRWGWRRTEMGLVGLRHCPACRRVSSALCLQTPSLCRPAGQLWSVPCVPTTWWHQISSRKVAGVDWRALGPPGPVPAGWSPALGCEREQ